MVEDAKLFLKIPVHIYQRVLIGLRCKLLGHSVHGAHQLAVSQNPRDQTTRHYSNNLSTCSHTKLDLRSSTVRPASGRGSDVGWVRLLCVGRHTERTIGRTDDTRWVADSTRGTVRRAPTRPVESIAGSSRVPTYHSQYTARHRCASRRPTNLHRRHSGRPRLEHSTGTTPGRSPAVPGPARRHTTPADCRRAKTSRGSERSATAFQTRAAAHWTSSCCVGTGPSSRYAIAASSLAAEWPAAAYNRDDWLLPKLTAARSGPVALAGCRQLDRCSRASECYTSWRAWRMSSQPSRCQRRQRWHRPTSTPAGTNPGEDGVLRRRNRQSTGGEVELWVTVTQLRDKSCHRWSLSLLAVIVALMVSWFLWKMCSPTETSCHL